MIPLRLQLSGFLSYRDPVELDFAGFDLACISGSNGAGKSSLLDAITWALFGQARKRDDSLINAHCAAMEVALEFAYEGNTYRVQRSKARDKPVFILFSTRQGEGETAVWRPITENSVRETEKRIEDTLRMDFETFTNAAFFLQGKADQFSQQRPADRKRVLSSILGLEVWETYREQATEQRRKLEKECDSIEGQLREIQAELGEEAARRAKLAALQADLDRLVEVRSAQETALESLRREVALLAKQREMVETLGRAQQAAQRSLNELIGRLEKRREERQTYADLLEHGAQIEAAYQAWQDARVDLARWEETAARFREQEKKRQEPLLEIGNARAGLNARLDALRAGQRELETAHAEKHRILEQAQALEAELAQANRRLERRGAVEVGLRELHQQQAEAKAENPRLRSEMEELKERIDQLAQSTGAECPTCGQPLSAGEREALVAALTAQGKGLGERYRQNQALLKDFENRVRAVDDEIKSLASTDGEIRRLDRQLDQIRTRVEQIDRLAEAWERDDAPRLAEAERQLAQGEYAPEAQGRLVIIDAELRAMGYDAAAHDVARRAELDGRRSELDLRRLENARSALAPIAREIGEMEAQLTALQAAAASQTADYEQALAAYQALESQAPDLDRTERELFDTRSKENALRMAVGSANQSVLVLNNLRERGERLSTRRDELNRRIGQYKTLERSFSKDGVPALLIEQALPEIETEANEILDRLSSGAMSVSFVTQREYKDRKRDDLRETLDILISDGAGTRDYELFSGGEAFRVNFAIRLALSRVLAQRAGARLQTLVIDEGFGSQDTQGRQRLIEAINLVRPSFAKILVITHMEELKDAFPTRIEVEKTSRGSVVQVMS